ncbi:MAG: asparagine synthase-related protein [Thermoproteota archaeon]|nr:asparagine synthase-related protein [Thermoproteota archaeon]
MPGIIGLVINKKNNKEEAFQAIENMQKLITYESYYSKDKIFCDGVICASRSHTNIIQKNPQPYSESGIFIWLDGEFYNQQDFLLWNKNVDDTALLLKLYKKNNDFAFLKKIDGIFSAVIYDSNTQKVHLITDRYGLRHLYWLNHRGQLAWSSEVKAFLALPEFFPKIDEQAVKEFFEVGYLLEDRTWFKNVELLPSGTVLSFDIRSKKVLSHRYWWWDEIKIISEKIDQDEAAEELGRLFIEAVSKRSNNNKHVGLMLSGGLDSRAILAALPDRYHHINTVTFGKKNCYEVLFAARASKLKSAPHCIVNLNSGNWLTPRISGVWWTDGQLDLMHMHGIEGRTLVRELFKINLNGFAGDLILGGSYLTKYSLDKFDPISIASIMRCDKGLIDISKYIDLKKADYYFLQNRVRRFTFSGTKHSLTSIEHRKPFYDNALIEFVYSLPDELRFDSYIYKKMLLKTFPIFFETIPWQKTGIPIGYPRIVEKASLFSRRVKKKFLRGISCLGHKFDNRDDYVDYQTWITQEPALSFFEKVLNNSSELYSEYIPKRQVRDAWEGHLEGEDNSSELCRYLTFEIWLQQVFEGKFRNGFEC